MKKFDARYECKRYVIDCLPVDVVQDFDIDGMVDDLFDFDECEQAYVLRDGVGFWDVADANDVSERG